MRNTTEKTRLRTAASLLAIGFASAWPGLAAAQATSASTLQADQQTPAASSVDDIVVTAQRRSQSVNQVPMSITAITGEDLQARGVTETTDLPKIVPGLTIQPSGYNTPVYTLRGVGFFDSSLAASPTVSVYTDEIPLPYSAMTRAAGLDLERVEVLKGPQGTLYGQNTTGGAINYVAAKPTDAVQAGFDASYSRFNTFDLQGFVSGPIAPTLRGRVALRTVQADDWQRSYTRDDTLGQIDRTEGRILLDWAPTEKLSVLFNLNGWIDKSDTQAPQLIAVTPQQSAGASAALLNYPISPDNARAADWTPGSPFHRDDRFYQAAIRADYDLTADIRLTSISAYSSYDTRAASDNDATALADIDTYSDGTIESFSQEFRLTGNTGDRLKWIVGANGSWDEVHDNLIGLIRDASNVVVIPGLPPLVDAGAQSDQSIDSWGIFINGEYELTDRLTWQVGARYTETSRDYNACSYDTGNNILATTFNVLQSVLKGGVGVVPIAAGGCVTFDQTFTPGRFFATLDEDNVSWRTGLTYSFDGGGLVYGNISQGYKSGSFPTLPTSTTAQYAPVSQESLLAYEVGFKAPLFDRRLQLNGAVFYYDYEDKQLLGKTVDPIFGVLSLLQNIPKSAIKGAELQIVAAPINGLNVSFGVTYLDTEVKDYTGINAGGALANFAGSPFPYTPEWQGVADAQYDWAATETLDAFVGAGLSYNSASNGTFGEPALFAINAHTLLDLRAGVQSKSGDWRLTVWGRNVTDEFYWTNVTRPQDTTLRFAGRPASYGVTLTHRY